ncbi:cytochrome b/b6 domain-containing protein [Cocleimonas flava]|uniref:Cytochrome b n=1 Tax=Cocleimonas flava TaxID=634765 RepID=A0A4V2P992_9GAMM|nr:cytochrome b/b6 domain-containing protein [Cocleimonas flava]TCJ88775.1 cytochrome b [Cocleimonas flava]
MKNLVKIWDSPTRLFHWLLVILFGFMWYSGETGNYLDLHMKSGMLILSLILFRLIWGFIGSTSSRFSNFISPVGAIKHALTLFKRDPEVNAGHNPLGGLMVIAMLVMLALQAGVGLFSSDLVLTEGPLFNLVDEETAEEMTDYHYLGFEILLYLTGLHVAAIVFYRIVKRTNLVKPMITGKADWPQDQAKPKLMFKNPFIALLVLIVSIATVFGGVTYLSGL